VSEKTPAKNTQLRVSGPVLLVDDDEEYRRMMEKLLLSFGLTSIPIESGAHCVRFVQNQPWNWFPSLIITDIVMDGMGGYQLMRRLQEQYPKKDIPIIVVSRLDAILDIAEAESAGATAYVKKPVDPQQLYEALDRIVNHDPKTGALTFTIDHSDSP